MEPVAAPDEVALDLLLPAGVAEADFRRAAEKIVNQLGVLDLEQNLPAVLEPLRDQVGDDLFLVVE